MMIHYAWLIFKSYLYKCLSFKPCFFSTFWLVKSTKIHETFKFSQTNIRLFYGMPGRWVNVAGPDCFITPGTVSQDMTITINVRSWSRSVGVSIDETWD
jgi:hypothetical protein